MKMNDFADAGKTNPIKPNSRKARMKLSSYSTKDYNNEQRTMNNERLCKTNPIKPNFKRGTHAALRSVVLTEDKFTIYDLRLGGDSSLRSQQ